MVSAPYMKRLSAFLLMFAVLTAHAQELNFWQKVNELLTTMKNIDSTYIYQPKQHFTLGLFSTVQSAGFDSKAQFSFREDGNVTSGVTKYSLGTYPSTKIGFELGYGKFVLGYGLEVGPKRAYQKRLLGVNLLGKAWGLHCSYFSINNTFSSTIELSNGDEEPFYADTYLAPDPAMLRYLNIDGYYVFNHKRFAYPATYKAGLVQRRTSGSWMVTMRFMHGNLFATPDASYGSYFFMDCFNTTQISLGGGYSVNFVCWHKDPTGLRDKGLRNITLNLTALPVLTALNHIRTTSYNYDDEEFSGATVSDIFGYPMPNFIGSTALGITLDRFFISARFVYDCSYFHSNYAFNADDQHISNRVDELTLRGYLHNWSAKLLFTYKF